MRAWWPWLIALAGCCPTPHPPPPSPTIAEWRAARRALDTLRASFPAPPYSMNVSLELTQPLAGKGLRARGAVAVDGDALRMILLGPGGTTALDLWVCGERYRLAIPALDLVRRGDRSAPPEPGLPVDFLRWWLARPLGGRLLHGDAGGFVLRDGEGWVHVRAAGRQVEVRRERGGDLETVTAELARCGRARYRQRSTALEVTVRCEKLLLRPPPPAALADPDHPSQPCRVR